MIAAIGIGMPIYETAGELVGTLSIVAIGGLTVLVCGLIGSERFDVTKLRRVSDEIASHAVGAAE